MENIGEKIYNLRKERGMSQEELAFSLNTTRQTVSRWETNYSKPTPRNMKCLCEIFGVDKNYFSMVNKIVTVDEQVPKEASATMSNSGIKIFVIIAVSIFLICCIVACCVASYVSFLPSYANGLNNAAVNRFRYIGIVCVVVGALAFIMLVTLFVIVVYNKKKQRKF